MAITATDTTAAGTSTKSSSVNVTVPLPAAPVISSGVVNANGTVTVTDGPFTETKEVIGGFAILNYASHEEAIDGARRVLQIHADHGITDLEIELRPMMDPGECGQQPQASAAA